jgi:hypothetical protein
MLNYLRDHELTRGSAPELQARGSNGSGWCSRRPVANGPAYDASVARETTNADLNPRMNRRRAGKEINREWTRMNTNEESANASSPLLRAVVFHSLFAFIGVHSRFS